MFRCAVSRCQHTSVPGIGHDARLIVGRRFKSVHIAKPGKVYDTVLIDACRIDARPFRLDFGPGDLQQMRLDSERPGFIGQGVCHFAVVPAEPDLRAQSAGDRQPSDGNSTACCGIREIGRASHPRFSA